MPIQTIQKIFAVFFFLLFVFSCSKVINVKLNSVPPQLVITGEVNNLTGPYKVSISRSINYTEDNNFPGVSGATVSITSNNTTDTLTETSPGVYSTHFLQGIPENKYDLFVSVDGETYTASSVMPQPVTLDSIGFTTGRNLTILNGEVFFQDPAGIANYYHFIEYKDGKQFPNNRGWTVFYDRLSNGRYISYRIDDDSTDIKSGDTVSIQMNCVDQSVYNYLNSLYLIVNSNGFQSPTPANPISNLGNNALGYFTAQYVQTKTKIVP